MTKNSTSLSTSENILKAAVFGANDGIVTTFAIVAGVSGASLSSKIVLILGISNMVADGISMGLGDFLGERSAVRYRLSHHLHQLTTGKVWYTGLATFLAFILAGFLPLVPYLLTFFGFNFANLFITSVVSTALSLFVVGSIRTLFIKGNWLYNGLEMLFVGTIAATAAYLIGRFIGNIASALPI